MKIKVRGSLNPVIVHMNGKAYVTPTDKGWLEVPVDTKLEDIEWTPTFKFVEKKNKKPIVRKVPSSDGKKVYIVTKFADGRMTCTCPGFQFRRFCKHTGAK